MTDYTTPRPWHCNAKVGYIWGDHKNPKANCQIAVVGGFITDKDLVKWNGKRWSADTELIIKAVNAHDDLVKALEAIITAADSDAASGGEMFWAEAVGPAIDAARSALAKARGKT